MFEKKNSIFAKQYLHPNIILSNNRIGITEKTNDLLNSFYFATKNEEVKKMVIDGPSKEAEWIRNEFLAEQEKNQKWVLAYNNVILAKHPTNPNKAVVYYKINPMNPQESLRKFEIDISSDFTREILESYKPGDYILVNTTSTDLNSRQLTIEADFNRLRKLKINMTRFLSGVDKVKDLDPEAKEILGTVLLLEPKLTKAEIEAIEKNNQIPKSVKAKLNTISNKMIYERLNNIERNIVKQNI